MSAGWLFASMAVGAVGGGYLLYGWRQHDGWALGVGALLSAVPFLISQTWLLLGVCVGIMALHATRDRWLP